MIIMTEMVLRLDRIYRGRLRFSKNWSCRQGWGAEMSHISQWKFARQYRVMGRPFPWESRYSKYSGGGARKPHCSWKVAGALGRWKKERQLSEGGLWYTLLHCHFSVLPGTTQLYRIFSPFLLTKFLLHTFLYPVSSLWIKCSTCPKAGNNQISYRLLI